MPRRRRPGGMALALVLLIGAVLALPDVAGACAVCGTGPPLPGHKVPSEFFWGSLFLLVIPFVVFAGMGGWLFYMHWRARRGRPEGSPLGALWDRARAWLSGTLWTRKESET